MAQIRKLQEGYTINKVPATKYFSVGDQQYNFNTFQDLVWHNFDPWAESKGYNNKTRDDLRKFINQAVEQIGSGNAKFNPDYSIWMSDVNDEWDDDSGFNKDWIGRYKMDDKGIPKVGTGFLKLILESPYMEKKPTQVALSNLTSQVTKNIAKLEFDNNYNKFNANFGNYSQKDRVRMFKNALINFRDTTDFSIYDQSTLKQVGANMQQAIDLLNNATTYDDDFFDKMSQYGFYGLNNLLKDTTPTKEEGKDEDTDSSEQKPISSQDLIKLIDNEIVSSDTPVQNTNTNTNTNSRRVFGKADYDRFVKGTLQQALSQYYNIMNPNMSFRQDWNSTNTVGFNLKRFVDDPLLGFSKENYITARKKVMDDLGETRQQVDERCRALSRQLVQFLLGINTQSFYSNADPQTVANNIALIMGKANLYSRINYLPMTRNYAFINDSYDPKTKSYLGIDIARNAFFAIPAIFVETEPWQKMANEVNKAIKGSGISNYKLVTAKDLRNYSLKEFVNETNFGNGKSFFDDIKKFKLKLKQGGILKALTGAEIIQSINNDTYGLFSEKAKSLYSSPYISSSNTANDKEKQEYIKRQNTEITSWNDLKNNLDTHDKWVISTLLSDIVALGGSLSGGAFNPVTDLATLGSIVGIIGTVATDKSMSFGEKLGYGTLGVGLSALGLIPGLGAGANSFKIVRSARRALPAISKIIRWGALGTTGLNALGPLQKLASGQHLTKGEWTSLAYFTDALVMGNIGRRANRDFKKYTKPVDQKTTYTIQTKNGPVRVSKQVYDELHNAKIKDIKKKYSADGSKDSKTKINYLKDLDGNDIRPEMLSTKPSRNGFLIRGSSETSAAGVRLKTLEELHQEYGIPKITAQGKTTYQVPRGYLRVAERLGQKPMTSIEEPTKEAVIEEAAPKQKPQAQQPKQEPPVGAKKPKELTEAQQKRKEKLEKIDDDVRQLVKDLIGKRYSGQEPWESKRYAMIFNKVQDFKNAAGNNFPSKLKNGVTYFVTPKKNVLGVSRRDNKKMTSMLQMYNKQKNKDKGFKYFAFKDGGKVQKYAWGDSIFDVAKKALAKAKREKYNPNNPGDPWYKKPLEVIGNIVKDPMVYTGLSALQQYRLQDKLRRSRSRELPVMKSLPNQNLYIQSPDLYGLYNQASKAIGHNNSTLRPTTSDIWVDQAKKYETNVVSDNALMENVNSKADDYKKTYADEVSSNLKNLDDTTKTIVDANSAFRIEHINNQLLYDQQKDTNNAATTMGLLEYIHNREVTKREAELSNETLKASDIAKQFNPYNDKIKEADQSYKKIYNDYIANGGTEEDWLTSNEYKQAQIFEKEKNKYTILKKLYELDIAFDASQGGHRYNDILKENNIDYNHPFFISPVKRKGGSLSYEDRMNLKRQDARNKKQEMQYRMIIEDHKRWANEKKQRDKNIIEANRLINRKSEILLKASLQLK